MSYPKQHPFVVNRLRFFIFSSSLFAFSLFTFFRRLIKESYRLHFIISSFLPYPSSLTALPNYSPPPIPSAEAGYRYSDSLVEIGFSCFIVSFFFI
jgi:hypothetical protein